MENIRTIVESHLGDSHFTVQKLCREAGISHPQLHRKLKARTGLSPVQFIRSIRLGHARKLLLGNPSLSIADIAYDSGFSDPDYFCKVFRQELGCTPSQFRERKRQGRSF